ncbi:hypothetical protein ACFL0D_03850 [Thermoproteota archaeon]
MSDQKLIEIVKKKTREMWGAKPKEVNRALTEVKGTYGQSFFAALYAESTTRDLEMTLMSVRDMAKQEGVGLSTLKLFLKNTLECNLTYLEWGGLDDTVALIREVCIEIEKIDSKESLITILEQLISYFNRLNFWIDGDMPWFQLVGVYEWVMKEV